MKLWEHGATVLIQGNSQKIDLKYPAVTVCPQYSSKYGIAERLGNYIDSDQLPERLLPLKREFFKSALSNKVLSPSEISNNYDDNKWIENSYDSGCGKIQIL